MEPLLIRQSRWSIWIQLISSVICLVPLYYVIHEKDNVLTSENAAAIVLVVFGALSILYVIKNVSRPPTILLDDEGVNDTRLNVGSIPWTEILQIYMVSGVKSGAVQLAVYHPEQYRSKKSPFVILTADMDTSPEALANNIYQRQMHNWSALGEATPVPTPPMFTFSR